ncbi:hypothetical protein [Shimia thalassica]|uniref:hypothetical protein n=1 Tax=Shimia thalassica TaxID=1715693 RepID=UPI0027361137|nr:hypothetical protein [Shimia thalassica]
MHTISKLYPMGALAFALLASCTTPSSNDGEQRILHVGNLDPSPVISIYVGRPGTTPASRQPTLDLINSNAEGMVDLLPFGANIKSGESKAFNIDDGNGTCVFEVYVKFADGSSSAATDDICKATRNKHSLILSG